MAKQEIKTDGMVRKMLQDVNIPFSEQGSDIKEINDALKSSSKKGTGKVGFPEFVAVVGDYLLVIEDKADVTHHVKIDDKGLISTMTKDVVEYAENGAYFYGKHLIENTSYKKIFAFGVSGSDKDYKITPLFINEREYCQVLDDVESFAQFSPKNIQDYYERNVLKIDKKDADLETIMKATKELHEYLRDYSNLETKEKPLIVSGILLALREIGKGSFSIDNLKGDDIKTDGSILFDAINDNLKRSNVSPDVKKEKVLNRFAFIKDSKMLNEVNSKLGMTPNKYYAKFIYDHIFETVKNSSSAEDYIGRFYGEFMSYSGGDGQTLGIILTPSHITSLFCDLLDLKPSDKVLDPTCGTGGFLVAAMHKMLGATSDPEKQNHIRKEQLHGIEIQEYMFTIATTNMILRGDGKSNIVNDDFLKKNPNELQLKGCNVGMMNPPYSQGKKDSSLYEILFVEHLLDSLVPGGKAAVIVPLSTMTGKTNIEQRAKERILKKHTLEGVITLNPNTFYGVGTNTCIAVFTAGQPNPAKHLAKFIDFKDDGFDVAQHVGLVEKPDAKDKRQHLLDVWFDRIDDPTKFSVKSTVKPEDEWLHSFYYFNEEIPTEKDVEQSVSDYLTFEFKMVMDGREYLFQSKNSRGGGEMINYFSISDFFDILQVKGDSQAKLLTSGEQPLVTAQVGDNGIIKFVAGGGEDSILFSGGLVTVDMFGKANFQPHEFYSASHGHVNILKPKDALSPNVLRYICASITKSMDGKFSFANMCTQSRLLNQRFYLPSADGSVPDFQQINDYVDGLIAKKKKSYLDFVTRSLDDLRGVDSSIPSMEEKEWGEFKMEDIFDIKPGTRLTTADMASGDRPFIGASDSNNGITNFVNNTNESLDQNVLGLNYNGSICEAFYHPYECIFSDDVKRLHLKCGHDNKYVFLFIKTVILKQKGKYTYGYKFNEPRMKRQSIMLPLTSDGKNPDWLWMEEFSKKELLKKYQSYISYQSGCTTE